MARAQFIVPLQHNYNQKIIIYYKIIYNVPYIKFAENIFGFLGNNHVMGKNKKEEIWLENKKKNNQNQLN